MKDKTIRKLFKDVVEPIDILRQGGETVYTEPMPEVK